MRLAQQDTSGNMHSNLNTDTYRVVRNYADAWIANDLKTIVDSYHDEVVFHYFGRNPLAGTHVGKPACMEILRKVREKTNRSLISVRDVLVGEHFGLIIALERFEKHGASVQLERMLKYRVHDDKLAECWVYDTDQRLVDEYWL
jgi:uncharacterized protein